MKLLSLFSGIGAFEAALDNIGIDFELVGYCEIDKYASKSYSAIHGVPESMNYGDITKIDEKKLPKDIDLITYGFPCQDISLAGKQKGLFNEDGSQTRSGLFFEALRIIEETQPKIAIAENVKNLVGKKFKEQFEIVLSSLEQAGYNNYWKVLNAKDFGIPQNRERVFIVSIRKDIDTGVFEFPEGYELKLRLKDLLEDEVDECFYLSDEYMKRFINSTNSGKYPCGDEYTVVGTTKAETDRMGTNSRHWVYDINDCMSTLDATMYKQPKQILVNRDTNKIIKVGHINSSQDGVVVSSDGIAKAHTSGHCNMPKILVKTNNSKGYDVAEVGDYINIERPGSTTRRGRVGHGVSQTLDTKENHCTIDYPPLRIRKLTPKECFRLMGFSDEDFEKAASVCSNTQLYKQAGNSIVVDVLEELFCMMFDEKGNFFI